MKYIAKCLKQSLCLVLAGAGGTTSNAQNLIADPGFETTTNISCDPYTSGVFNTTVVNWKTPTLATPALFGSIISNTCINHQPNSNYQGPLCIRGNQSARSGTNFAGIYLTTFPGTNQRQYLQTQLTSPLTPGETYCVEMYISLADSVEAASNNLGVYFSDIAVGSNNDQVLPFTPQVLSTVTIADKTNWKLVSGSFKALTANAYITIGNFSNDAATTKIANSPLGKGGGCYGAYYFIDDVSVVKCAAPNTTGIMENRPTMNVSMFPNPARDVLKLKFDATEASAAKIVISNIYGEIVLQKQYGQLHIGENEMEVPVETLKVGTYNFHIDYGGKTFNSLFIKN